MWTLWELNRDFLITMLHYRRYVILDDGEEARFGSYHTESSIHLSNSTECIHEARPWTLNDYCKKAQTCATDDKQSSVSGPNRFDMLAIIEAGLGVIRLGREQTQLGGRHKLRLNEDQRLLKVRRLLSDLNRLIRILGPSLPQQV